MNDFSHFPPAWAECTRHFLEDIYRRSSSQTSRDTYRRALLKFFSDPQRSPADYTRADVARFLEARSPRAVRNKDKPPAIATQNLRLVVLKSFYAYASAYEIDGAMLYEKASPTAGFSYGKPAIKYKAFSPDELDRFWASFDRSTVKGKRDFAIFWFYFLSCRRRTELQRLIWGDIERATIIEKGVPRHAWTYKFYGKGQSQMEDRAELPDSVMEAIVDYLQASGRYESMKPTSPIFAALKPGQGRRGSVRDVPLNGDYINLLLKSQLEACGLDTMTISIHSFRHSSARERAAAGEDIRSIQRVLRHSSLATTDRYVSLLVSSADPGARLLEARYRR